MADSLLNNLLEQADFLRKPRLTSLFSDFSPLAVTNRDGYDANINAWINALNRILLLPSDLGQSCLSVVADKALAASLTSKQWGRPLALSSVELEAKARQVWIPRSNFMTREDSIYDVPSMFANLTLGNAVRWGVSKVWSKQTSSLSGETYVIVPDLEEVARKVTATMKEETETTFSAHITTKGLLQSLIAERTGLRFSDPDFEVLVKFLQRDKSLISVSGDTVKFASTGSTEPITETDVAVASIKSTLSSLQLQIKSLTASLTEIDTTLRESLYGSKSVALNALRRKKAIEATLSARLDNRDTLEAVLTKLDEAALNVGLVKAMAGAAGALKRLNASVGGLDAVDRVLDDVREQMDLTDEVGAAIRQDASAAAEMDEEQIQQEYAAMLAETEAAKPATTVPQEVVRNDDALQQQQQQHQEETASTTKETAKEETHNAKEQAETTITREAVPA